MSHNLNIQKHQQAIPLKEIEEGTVQSLMILKLATTKYTGLM